ncbi:Aim32p SCDLUD_000436 [Saccharomycodes ludwigii]|uniref:Aim32p n=1 Tax=Saccharomycodes ludwigii TaxID=36035 RepID=UPI001E85D7ED|nr:hypothetical protein SCDLUD_000436 [Saccharomycodes ludwigii]KAH3902844.1 hypothetical protein SCDLUD_000436 [Saccharomycodes ludwigii]
MSKPLLNSTRKLFSTSLPLFLNGTKEPLFNNRYNFISIKRGESDIDLNRLTLQCNCFLDELDKKSGFSVERLNLLQHQEKYEKDESVITSQIPFYNKHLLLLTPPNSYNYWNSRIESDSNWPYSSIGHLKQKLLKSGVLGKGLLINAISMENYDNIPSIDFKEYANFLSIPEMKLYSINVSQLDSFDNFLIKQYKKIGQATDIDSKVYNPFIIEKKEVIGNKDNTLDNPDIQFKVGHFNLNKGLILVCGHKKRDSRCGYIAPYIIDELKRSDLNNYHIGVISHIGGHKYAGNLIIYKFNNFSITKNSNPNIDGIWLKQVYPQFIKTIIDNIEQNNIIKELYRGLYTSYK